MAVSKSRGIGQRNNRSGDQAPAGLDEALSSSSGSGILYMYVGRWGYILVVA